ncbi:MAG TPA: hypothetical protein VIY47_03525, partial [Ignavibacteriaceae bacterium]
KFPSLKSDSYKLKKKKEVGNNKADIQLSGDTLDAFDFKVTSDGLKIGVFGSRAPVADGHNNLSGNSELPLRRFIPDEGDSYKSSIVKEVDRIIADALSDTEISKSDLKGIESKSDLYDRLSGILGISSRSELRLAVFRNDSLLNLLEDEGLVDLL